jgi:ERCC4-type nuclease
MEQKKTLYVDSREQWTQGRSTDTHIKNYLIRHKIPYEVRCLQTGDYTYEGSNIVVDRKMSLAECASNLLNRNDSARFWREVRRAKEQGLKLIILVEAGPAVKNINDVARWKSKYSPVSGRSLIDAMVRVEYSYGTVFKFCSKASTAKRIIELLEGKE